MAPFLDRQNLEHRPRLLRIVTAERVDSLHVVAGNGEATPIGFQRRRIDDEASGVLMLFDHVEIKADADLSSEIGIAKVWAR